MITHILKDGSKVDSISGKVISSKEFPIIYKLIGGGLTAEAVSKANTKSSKNAC